MIWMGRRDFASQWISNDMNVEKSLPPWKVLEQSILCSIDCAQKNLGKWYIPCFNGYKRMKTVWSDNEPFCIIVYDRIAFDIIIARMPSVHFSIWGMRTGNDLQNKSMSSKSWTPGGRGGTGVRPTTSENQKNKLKVVPLQIALLGSWDNSNFIHNSWRILAANLIRWTLNLNQMKFQNGESRESHWIESKYKQQKTESIQIIVFVQMLLFAWAQPQDLFNSRRASQV